MNRIFYDMCYEILSHYLNFPDVADTYKSIEDGIQYCNNYPQTMTDFMNKKDDIIRYIRNVRKDNVIDAYKNGQNPLLVVPSPFGKLLLQLTPNELYINLVTEIRRLIIKGIHQTIKHYNGLIDNNDLTAELLQEDFAVLRKYNLYA